LKNKIFRKLFVKPKNPFSGFEVDFEEANYIFVGFPFDKTSTYRFGSRKAPNTIREASLNIETYSFRSGLYFEDLKIHDLGNLKIDKNFKKTFSNLKLAVSTIFSLKKFLVVLGGEHTLTFSVGEALPTNVGIISFDAHLDLRNEYLGKKFSHTTFMRRLAEKIGGDRLFFVGVRAVCKEELEFLENEKIKCLTSVRVKHQTVGEILKKIKEFASNFSGLYLTLDMDVLDPSYAPAVSNPEPEGLDPSLLYNILYGIGVNVNVVGLDLVEVSPDYDFGVTSILAAKTIFETLCSVEKGRRIKVFRG